MIDDKAVVKSTYFANWGDIYGFPLARKLLPFVIKIKFLTPNVITILAFILYALGSIFLFIEFPYHLIFSAILLPLGFLLDDLDGQVARARKLSSKIGDYLDKTLDVLKIYLVTVSLSVAAYQKTEELVYIFLGFTACFFFIYRFYIKYAVMFNRMESDENYLDKSTKIKDELTNKIYNQYQKLSQTLPGKFLLFWHRHKLIFFVDEAEFALFAAFFALIDRVELALWILAVSQVIIAVYRFFQRGYQLSSDEKELLLPLRK